VDYLQPGPREIGRQVARLLLRARLAQARRRRDRALTDLGLLGWQQADFDAETQRQVDEIQNVEREQSRTLNIAATLGAEIRELTSARDAGRRAHHEARKELEAALRKAAEAKAHIERQVAEKRKVEPNFQRRIPELDRELREVNKLYSQLLVIEKQTVISKQELIRLRERIVAIPNEKNDLRTHHLRAVTELRALEETLAREAEATTAAQQRVHYADSQWQAKEAEFTTAIKAKEKEKAAAERHFAGLERAKTNPYLRIGEVLSGSGIAPVNQPESLDRVRECDVALAIVEGELQASRDATAKEDPTELRLSLWLWGATALLVLAMLYALIF
jgi:chromosome segregation ATPase